MSLPVVVRYVPGRAEEWDAFVAGSRNGTFLFHRAYMDYHADRFRDHSLFLEVEGRPVALLPAHESESELVSHGGLTYGGFIVGERATLSTIGHCFDAVACQMREQGLERLIYKTIPHIYHRQPAEEDLYALFLRGAERHRRDVLLVLDNQSRGPMQERRTRALKRATRAGLIVRESRDYAKYWPVLSENLQSKYGVGPVHTLPEIEMLALRFPENIQLAVCTAGERVLGGVVVYASDRVAHLQYIASSAEGRECGALDAVIAHLMERWRDRRYFDFGAATENDGRQVNAGLVEFKEAFGARTVIHDHYTMDVRAAT